MPYILSTSVGTVDEGSNVTITLETPFEGLPNGTLIPFTIVGTGVDSADFLGNPSLSGNFRITDNRAKIVLDAKRDLKTELNESFVLTLGTPGAESIGVTIIDTSKTSPNTFGYFYITSPKVSILEGDTTTFNVRAMNVAPGTAITYSILGVQQTDLDLGTTLGSIVLESTGRLNETQANITFGLKEDFSSEGQESIIVVLEPDFPYQLQVSQSVTVQDTSVSVAPVYTIYPDKTKVVEGGNVTFYLEAQNVPDGYEVPWRIERFRSSITLADFEGLTSLTGTFPPLSGNVANVTFVTRDDFVFEQSEFFFVTVPNAASIPVEIVDSGNTFLQNDNTYTGNATIYFLDSAVLVANLGCLNTSKAYWKDTTGIIDEDIVLQGKTSYATEDSLAMYQPFSYVIRSSKSIEEWGTAVKSILHPAGLTIFSEINNETKPESVISLGIKATDDIEIDTYYAITVDSQTILASNTTSRTDSSFTVDSISSLFNL